MNLRRLVRWKIYLDRARVYLAYVQMLMMAGLCYDVLSRRIPWVANNAWRTLTVLVAVVGGGCLLLGWLDTRLGVLDEEIRQVYGNRLQTKAEE